MPSRRRTAFFISDGTGITAEMLGHSLLTQFEGIEFHQITLPFIDSNEKAEACVLRINAAARADTHRPLVFTTLVNGEIRDVLRKADALLLDFFEAFLSPLEGELGETSAHTIGRSHSARDIKMYTNRIEAINFAMAHDDGASSRDLEKADVILVGVSRSGKTPTSLYLSLQYGVRAANYPLIPEDFDRMSLPRVLDNYRYKLYGLSIAPERLSEVRNERRPNSKYADLDNCRYEVEQAEKMMEREGIRWANSTLKSIEEIATTILHDFKLERRVY
jgi:regulator of PEP synthase PpsR (kinase-PPPase family)